MLFILNHFCYAMALLANVNNIAANINTDSRELYQFSSAKKKSIS